MDDYKPLGRRWQGQTMSGNMSRYDGVLGTIVGLTVGILIGILLGMGF